MLGILSHLKVYFESFFLKSTSEVSFTKSVMFCFVKVTFKTDKLLLKVDCLHWKASCESRLSAATFERTLECERGIFPVQTVPAFETRSIWKMMGPFATASRRTPPVLILHCHSPGVATVDTITKMSRSQL